MSYFPMMVDLESKDVLVVGGGEEGTKKVNVLADFGASITLISESATPQAEELADTFIRRNFKDEDILNHDYALIVAATDDRTVNSNISELARRRKIPVNVVDDAPLCTFIFPAIIKDRDVVCAVSSGGKSPYVAQHIKSLIRGILPDNIGEINDRMGEYRLLAKEKISGKEDRRAFLREKLNRLLRQ